LAADCNRNSRGCFVCRACDIVCHFGSLSMRETTMTGSDNPKIQALVERPNESLAIEVKTWFDPNSREGQAKIVRAVLALRNNDGGYLLVGFDDTSMLPDLEHAPVDVRATFHPDKIHELVTRFASESFEVSVEFGERDGTLFPVIVVPSGIRTPIAAKSDLIVGERKLVAAGEVYVRTLNTNRRPSSAKANWNDWPLLMDKCFNNREADIGRFFRRHLTGLSVDSVQGIMSAFAGASAHSPSEAGELQGLLDTGRSRFDNIVAERSLTLPKTGFWEVALVIRGPVPAHPLREFMKLIGVANPEYSGWPVWLDSSHFGEPAHRTYVFDKRWEALVALPNGRHTDFLQFDPKGKFYHLRALFDDLRLTNQSPAPGTALDIALPILDSAEAIAVGLAFAKAMGCPEDTCTLEFAFRWSGLNGRELASWIYAGRYISPGRKAYQDDLTLTQSIPLNTPPSAIGGILTTLLAPLYEVFSGFALGANVFEDLSAQLLARRAQV